MVGDGWIPRGIGEWVAAADPRRGKGVVGGCRGRNVLGFRVLSQIRLGVLYIYRNRGV